MQDKLLHNQLAFYTTEDTEDFLAVMKEGKLESMRIGRVEQRRGDLVGIQGAPLYSTITRITDIETNETYEHNFCSNREASYILFKDFDRRAHNEIGYMYTSIDYHKEMICEIEEKMGNLTEGIKQLNEVVDMYLVGNDNNIKIVPKGMNTQSM